MNIRKYFEDLRHHEASHEGSGDIRLTYAQQEEIIAAFDELREQQDDFAMLKAKYEIIDKALNYYIDETDTLRKKIAKIEETP